MNPTDNVGLTDFLVLVYKFVKRNLLILSISTVFGFGVSLLYTSQKSHYFNSEMVGFSNVIEKTTLLEILNPLSALVQEKNHQEIANLLNLSKEKATKIRSLEFADARHLVTSHAPKTTDKKLGELIVIKASVYDQQILEDLSNGIKHYLSSNPYISSTHQLMAEKNKRLIVEISNNISLIDSLNRSMLQQQEASISFQQSQNPNNYGEALLMLEDFKVISTTLKPFTIVSSFYNASKPANKNILIITVITVTFFVIGLMIVFVKELAQLAAK